MSLVVDKKSIVNDTNDDDNKKISSSLRSSSNKIILKPIVKKKEKKSTMMKKNVEELLLHTANIYNNKVALLSSSSSSVLTDHNNNYVSRSSNTTTSHDLNVDDDDDDDDDDNISEYSMLSPIPSSSSSSTMIINPTLLLPLSLYISQDKINQSFTNHNNSSCNASTSYSIGGSGSSIYDINDDDSIGILESHRSSDDSYSSITGYSMSSRVLTQRELLSQVTSRAWNNKEPLSYIPRLDELLPMHLSWNSKVTKNNEVSNYYNCQSNHTQTMTTKVPKNYDKKRPTINIIG